MLSSVECVQSSNGSSHQHGVPRSIQTAVPVEIFLAEMFMAELASFLHLLLLLGGPLPSHPALRLEAARLLLSQERPVVAASLVGRQPASGGREGAAQVLEGAGQGGDHLHQPVGGLGETLGGPVHVHPADGAVVAAGPAVRAQGVAVGAGGHGGPGDDSQADRALQQLQQSASQRLFFLINSLKGMFPHVALHMLGDLLHDAVNLLLSVLVQSSQGSFQFWVTAVWWCWWWWR